MSHTESWSTGYWVLGAGRPLWVGWSAGSACIMDSCRPERTCARQSVAAATTHQSRPDVGDAPCIVEKPLVSTCFCCTGAYYVFLYLHYMLTVRFCLSVCPYTTPVICTRTAKRLYMQAEHSTVLAPKTAWGNSKELHMQYENVAIFCKCMAIPRHWYKTSYTRFSLPIGGKARSFRVESCKLIGMTRGGALQE